MAVQKSVVKLLQWSRPQLRTETRRCCMLRCRTRRLQWSRPQLRTETRRSPLRRMGAGMASMEPSSVEDGNTKLPIRAKGDFIWLQWSRPQLRTETNAMADGQPDNKPLQWSRPQLRTETSRLCPAPVPDSMLQWSRPQLRTETLRSLRTPIHTHQRFNGAVLS